MASPVYNTMWQIIQPLIWGQLRLRARAGKEDASRISERYGIGYLNQKPDGKLIWLHAVSVGESVAALSLARALKAQNDALQFLITTNTTTAAARIEAADPDISIRHAYQPLDHPKWVKRFLQYWQPDAAIFLESDFWPNLVCETLAAQIPMYFASSQISERAYQRWRKRPSLAAKIFGAANKIFAVDDSQAQLFHTLSGSTAPKADLADRNARILAEGSLKLDLNQLMPNPAYLEALTAWKQCANRPILLLASSHEGEETLMMEGLNTIDEAERPLLIIAPRHPDRGDAVAQEISIDKRLSQKALPTLTDRIFLADTLGDMGSLYAAADIILLGGSFVDLGGHNPLEPASFAKPILSGPSNFKNTSAFDALSNAGAVKYLDKIEALAPALKDWQDAETRHAAGKAGKIIADKAEQAPMRVALAILSDLQAQERL